MDTTTYIDIVNKVDQFYNSAWNKVIIFGGALLLIVGIIMPFILEYIAIRRHKSDLERIKFSLKSELTVFIAKEIEELREFLKSSLSHKFEIKHNVIDYKIDKIEARSQGYVFFLQGKISFREKDYQGAFFDFYRSIQFFIKGEDFTNLNSTLNIMKNIVSSHITIKELKQLEDVNKVDFDYLVDEIYKLESGGSYKKAIDEIKISIYKLKNPGEQKGTP